jgi:L,D-transpeptidase ErfK/SrfK
MLETFLLASALMLSGSLTGAESVYTVRAGDSLTSVGARFGITVRVLAEENGLGADSRLRVGQTLRIDNRHIAPAFDGTRIVINVPQRMLFWTSMGGTIQALPIAAGTRGWQTPMGDFTVKTIETDPVWDVPLSIQKEMICQGKPAVSQVPPGPNNPLGKYWIGLSIPALGIHSTNQPSSIYGLVSHGCIRVHPEDISQLFAQVEVGMPGKILYEPVLLANVEGAVYLEVHPDAYEKGPDPLPFVLARARAEGYEGMLDLALVNEVIRKRDGIARNVTRR